MILGVFYEIYYFCYKYLNMINKYFNVLLGRYVDLFVLLFFWFCLDRRYIYSKKKKIGDDIGKGFVFMIYKIFFMC